MSWLVDFSQFFFKSSVGRILGILLMTLIAFMAYTRHIRKEAATNATLQATREFTVTAEKETQGETDRRVKSLEESQRVTQKGINELLALQKRNSEKLREINNASRSNDSRACLDADSVQRLREIR